MVFCYYHGFGYEHCLYNRTGNKNQARTKIKKVRIKNSKNRDIIDRSLLIKGALNHTSVPSRSVREWRWW